MKCLKNIVMNLVVSFIKNKLKKNKKSKIWYINMINKKIEWLKNWRIIL